MNRKNDLIRQLIQSTRGANNLSSDETLINEAFALLNPFDIGWADYNNAGGAVNFAPGSWQALPNDGTGPFTNATSLPLGISPLLSGTGDFDFRTLAVGSLLLHRHDVSVTVANNNTEIDLRLRLAIGDAGAYSIPIAPPTQMKAAGTYQLSGMIAFYIGNEITRANPARIEIKSDGAGSFINAGSFMVVAAR